MASLNKVFLIGNLTRDPELRYTPNGSAVTDLGLAVNRSYNTKEGERREEVAFIDVTVWNRQAENCCQYLKKGRPVHVEGSLRMDTWDDKTTGEKRSKLKVDALNVQFLGGKGDEGGNASEADFAPTPARDRDARRPEPSRGPAGNGASRGGYAAPGAPPRRPEPPADSDDDDIPF